MAGVDLEELVLGHCDESSSQDDQPDDVAFTLRIDRNFESFTEEAQQAILAAVASLLRISRAVTVVRTRAFSVLLTIRLRREEAQRLLQAIKVGALREYGVVDGKIEGLAGTTMPAHQAAMSSPGCRKGALYLPVWKEQRLCAALRAAFPSTNALVELLQERFSFVGVAERFATAGAWTEQFHELLALLDQAGQLGQFLDAVGQVRPTDGTLEQLAWEYPLISDLARRLGEHGLRPDSRVENCYRSICLDGWNGSWHSRTPLDHAWELVEHMVSPASPRSLLLVFVRGLAAIFPECKIALEEWEETAVRRLSERYSVSADDLRAALSPGGHRTTSASAGPFWLSVVVQPGKSAADPFAIKGWLSFPGDEETVALLDEPLEAVEKDLPCRLIDLTAAALGLLSTRYPQVREEQLQIELFLPRSLLCRDADQWETEEALPIGYHHPFVVRWLERWSNPRFKLLVQKRWDRLARAAAAPPVVTSLPADGYAAYWLPYSELPAEHYLDLRESDEVVCVLIGSPLPAGDEVVTPLCRRILEAGVPAVLWLRQPPGAECEALQDTLTPLVNRPLQELPRVVWQQRRHYRPNRPPRSTSPGTSACCTRTQTAFLPTSAAGGNWLPLWAGEANERTVLFGTGGSCLVHLRRGRVT
jgi:hypothetical protein